MAFQDIEDDALKTRTEDSVYVEEDRIFIGEDQEGKQPLTYYPERQ